MKDEIKEILEELESLFEISEAPEHIINGFNKIKDCITNLQEEVEDLREDNYAYHQLMKMQNKREYRSKFLKEFQEEFGTNVFPDYDEIYKRYDKLKKENEKWKENHKAVCIQRDNILDNIVKNTEERIDYKSKCDAAINFIDQVLQFHLSRFNKKQIDEDINTLIGILSKRGDSNK